MQELETLNVIIAGHIDHGKTTLLYKLSRKWADTHSEELKRGITIKLGYSDVIIYKNGDYNIDKKGSPKRYITFIDAPGHEMLMATMLSGAAIVDAAILVVAANEGIKPQTREHLMALQSKDIKNVIIVQNKIDLVTKEKAIENYNLIQKEFKGTIAENSLVIPVSSQQEINLERIYEALCEIKIPIRNSDEVPLFLIARSFDINKPGTSPKNLHGTILGGTLKSGKLKIGDLIEVKPGVMTREANQLKYKTVKTKIASIFKGSNKINELFPGGNASIETELDMAVGKSDSLSGCVASLEGKLPEIATKIAIKYNLFKEPIGGVQILPLKLSETIMLSINTSVTIGTISKLGPQEAEISLKIPVVPFKENKLGIARNVNNHWRLIGYGEIIR
ncbi:translation initiation factor IF-2 subunit gamma [Candidatus Pacearchaeota archaeon]|nr:translation initiation factor IF-2 subunit gamma [Candidatus Pacearchaeota archaeon]